MSPSDCPSLLSSGSPPEPGHERPFASDPPACSDDLHLDAVVAAMAPGPFQRAVWWTPLTDTTEVAYRQGVVEELRQPGLRRAAWQYSTSMAAVAEAVRASADAPHPVSADLARLEAISRFMAGVMAFRDRLSEVRPGSAGLRRVAGHLNEYVYGLEFGALATGSDRVRAALHEATFELGLHGPTLTIEPDAGRPGWAERILRAFAPFEEYSEAAPLTLPDRPHRDLNHVEAHLVALVADLYPDTFADLHHFVTDHADFLPPGLARLGEELDFYIGFLRVADSLVPQGVSWSLPRLTPGGSGPHADALKITDLVDLALALRARPSDPPLSPNDLTLDAGERLVFVTGPNQGGKTTLARALGLLAHLASLGLLVPAAAASVPLFGSVLTHFPRSEHPGDEHGALADEVVRLHGLLGEADERSLVIVNELFSSTSAQDALELSTRVVRLFGDVGCRVVWVTYLDELVAADEGAVSLVGQVASEDPTRPTFVFTRQSPTGRSHAVALAARHGLDAASLERRLR